MSVDPKKRLISLDVFRGITIAGMILVNNPGSWSHVYPALEHAEWNGCTPTDLIFPFFLFIMGVAITLSLSKRKQRGENLNKILLKILRRSATLFLLGLIMAGFPKFDLSTIRIPGVLQRIAVVYLISAFIFLKSDFKFQIFITFFLLILYWAVMTLIPVPDLGYATLEKGKNLAAWLDRLILDGHMWRATKTWDPEGVLSTIPAISTGMLGVLTGHLLSSDKDKKEKTVNMFVYGVFLMFFGYVWDMWFPMNKSIWTSSYVLYTGGLALQFLAVCYWFIDVKGVTWWAKPFQVYGLNAITVFFLSGIFAKILYLTKVSGPNGETVSVKHYIYLNYFASWLPPTDASLAMAITYVLIWLGLMWILYEKKIFIKV